mmetsp:Transcript_10120/g.27142  ORF Transcript_10120/g.27142 Transcript_10120/m.27142 type:complete len:243 (+) Transcript_10120:833-1561(+)
MRAKTKLAAKLLQSGDETVDERTTATYGEFERGILPVPVVEHESNLRRGRHCRGRAAKHEAAQVEPVAQELVVDLHVRHHLRVRSAKPLASLGQSGQEVGQEARHCEQHGAIRAHGGHRKRHRGTCERLHLAPEFQKLLRGILVERLAQFVLKAVVSELHAERSHGFGEVAHPLVVPHNLEIFLLTDGVENLPHGVHAVLVRHRRVQRRPALERVSVAVPRVRRATRLGVRLAHDHLLPILR